MPSSDRFSRLGRTLTVAVMLAACGGGGSSSGTANSGGTAGIGGTPGTGGAEPDASATPDVSAGSAGEGVDADSDGAAPTDDAVDVMEEPVPCGAEKEICCNDMTCTDSGLTCNDHVCLSCGAAIPSLSPGCVNVARGILPTALQTSPNNPLVNATDGTPCTAWGSGDFADIPDSGVEGTWWQLDLGSVMPIDSMTLWMAQTPPDIMVRLRIESSTDGTTWVPWRNPPDFTMMLHASDPWVTAFHDGQGQPIALRYLKITFLDSASFISIRELALFACPADGGT